MAGLGSIAPYAKLQLFTDGGLPAAGYQVFFYEAGTTTKLDTFSDSDLTVPNTNPVVLDSAGRATVFLSPLSYKFIFTGPTDTDPPTSPIWTVDNIGSGTSSSTNSDIPGTAGEALTFGQAAYCSDGFGGKTTGRWYKASAADVETSSNITFIGFVLADVAAGAAGTFRISGRLTGLSALTTGSVYFLSDTPGAIQTTSGTRKRGIGFADSSSSLLVSLGLGLYIP